MNEVVAEKCQIMWQVMCGYAKCLFLIKQTFNSESEPHIEKNRNRLLSFLL